MNMNEQQYVSPFAATAHTEPTLTEADRENGPSVGMDADEMVGVLPVSYVGFKAPVPWEGWTDEQRRAEYGGFLYPSWYPFAALEGNFHKSPYLPETPRPGKPKVQTAIDEGLERRKKQFAVPMQNKNSYTPNVPVGVLKRA